MNVKTYTGTKTVTARPMNRQEYNDYRNWILPADEDGSDEGYLVEYTDGGKPNHSAHEGYISWSPKEQFDAAYKPSGTWQERLRIEHDELEARTKKLDAFLSSPERADADVEALEAQLGIMQSYLAVLAIRLEEANA